ncbi:MAG: L-threonylcarbamoyladenylate synthase [Alphaproteobacteria bacterium]|nr:L-threonylcarbamoyladenylate synthase [Alphaproteobacteria bacterium]
MTPSVQAAAAALQRPGAVILYPTETVYGLGGRAGDSAACRRIAAIKDRPMQPLIVLLDQARAEALQVALPPLARALAARFWPGPLTLIVPAAPVAAALAGGLAPELLGPEQTVSLRWSGHPVADALVEAAGPITSTSANRHGEPPLLALDGHALAVDAVLDVGPLAPAQPSTLVLCPQRRVLRAGALAAQVEALLAEPRAGA